MTRDHLSIDRAKPRRKIVICATLEQFIKWCRDNDTPPHSAVYANRPEKLMGLEIKEEDVVRTGLPPDNLYEIERMLKTRIR
jgi:hypothetical protein